MALKRAAGIGVEEEAMRHAPVPIGRIIATSAGRFRKIYDSRSHHGKAKYACDKGSGIFGNACCSEVC